MVTRAASKDTKDSETLLKQICDIMFDNTSRYLKMKSCFPDDFILDSTN